VTQASSFRLSFLHQLAERIRGLRAFVWHQSDSRLLVLEDEATQQEFDRRDAEDPEWDRPARVAGAMAALERGVPYSSVVSVYGSPLAKEAAATINAAQQSTASSYSRSKGA
jgi:hypothetical protein